MKRAALLAFLLLLAAPAAAQERWVGGDLHEHVCPPDLKGEVTATFTGCIAAAKEGGVEFLVFTPHLRGEWWRDGARARAAVQGLAELASRCQTTEICAIPGFEDTENTGHLGVAFVDSAVLDAILDEAMREKTRGPFIARLVEKGALVTINHPLAGGDRKAKLAEFGSDLSWKAWTKGTANADTKAIEEAASCVEVFNAAAVFGEAALRVKEEDRLINKTFTKIDALALATGKKYAPVGGSDNHAFWLLPTTWVRVPVRKGPPLASEVRDALAMGRTCAGGPEAGSLEARTPASAWAKIGDELSVDGENVSVRFEGQGELFLDGRSLGVVEGSTRIAPSRGARHLLRLVRKGSYSGYIYIDWAKPAPPKKMFR